MTFKNFFKKAFFNAADPGELMLYSELEKEINELKTQSLSAPIDVNCLPGLQTEEGVSKEAFLAAIGKTEEEFFECAKNGSIKCCDGVLTYFPCRVVVLNNSLKARFNEISLLEEFEATFDLVYENNIVKITYKEQ